MKPREAATVMLVRDAPDLQVFMLRRNLRADWVGGAYVFPGGALDPDDRAPQVLARCPGRSDADASAHLGHPAGGLGYWVAAIRETFEEAGVLLARHAGRDAVDPDDLTTWARLEAARDAINAGEATFGALLEDEDLLLRVEDLHVFSHWITPAGMPRRYDTWFFVAEAPEGHAYLHDDGETVESVWTRPQDALDRGAAGEIELIFPTRRNLEALTRFETADALLAFVRAATDVPAATQPRIVRDSGGGDRLLLPGDEGYDAVEDPDDGTLDVATVEAAATRRTDARAGQEGAA